MGVVTWLFGRAEEYKILNIVGMRNDDDAYEEGGGMGGLG